MIEEFNKYVNNYDLNNKYIKLKYDHSFRVMELSEKYATALGLYDEDIKLAKEIGLLHDIGRFEQYKKYKTFVDSKSIDHADYGASILFDENGITKFDNNKNHWNIIKLAIKNHNKFEIIDAMDDKSLIHCHLIRDTDKIDILYNWSTLGEIEIEEGYEKVSSKVFQSVKDNESVKRCDIENNSDRNVSFMAFIFDIHFDECVMEAYKYIKRQYNKINNKEPYKSIMKIIDKYVNDRIGIKER